MVIDSTLGVETTVNDIPLEQIPFKHSPVHYDHWTRDPQPSRGLLYPDDAPPVLATISAAHPNSGNADKLESDGAGALKVALSGGGGGGMTPVAIPDPQGEQQLVLSPGQTDSVDYSIPVFVLGIQFCWRWAPFGTVPGLYTGSLIIKADGDGIGSLPICFSYANNQIGGIPGGVYLWTLPVPLDVTGWTPPAPGVFRIEAFNNSNANAIAVEINPFFG